ncbi:MAG: sulfur reduction protein DsrS [Gammaproteobacteria bacterium]|nr:sulfur reduction protein DsrS [Gammaproteobacteria bacterium]
MELSSEDSLRLNVMLANKPLAIRIDDSAMRVDALMADDRTLSVKLNPIGRDEPYIRRVRELLSTQILGSPGGYPVFISRWTRMGQTRDITLERLLMIGEPEAVVAAVHSPGLDNELARRAWWCMQNSDNARCMLLKKAVAEGDMGAELAQYLVDYLPFETEDKHAIESIRLMLQARLVDQTVQDKLWRQAGRKSSYYVAFLHALPDELPGIDASHAQWLVVRDELEALVESGNAFATQLSRLLSPPGQAWLRTIQQALKKPSNQDVISSLMLAIDAYFGTLYQYDKKIDSMEDILGKVQDDVCGESISAEFAILWRSFPELQTEMTAMLVLAHIDESVVIPVFARSDAIGSLMRRKLEPVTTPLLAQIKYLYG